MKIHKLIITLAFFFVFSSFGSDKTIEIKQVVGTYSVCGSQNLNSPLLILNVDMTFYYTETLSSKQKVAVTGAWTLVDGTVILKSSQKNTHFPYRWKVGGKDQCLRSRKNMSIYRLCNSAQTF